MIKCYTLIAFSLLTFVAAFAQKPKVNIEKMHDKSLHFYMSKESNMPYTAFISFYELYNVKNKPVKNTVQKFVVDDSNTPFLRLYPENPQRQAGASYRVSIMRGDLNKVADVDYVYMAPVSQDREIEFDIKGDVSKQLYPLTGKDLYEIRLNTEYGDTIYATRAGYAYNIKTQTEEQFADKPIKNAIYLYHADGASTKYMIASIFKPFVSKEQYVRAGDPIGVIVKPENINAELTFKPSAKLSLKFDAFFDMKNIDAETLKLLDEEMLNNTEFGALKDL